MGSGAESSAAGSMVRLSRSDGWFVATDEETGVASQGETKADALDNLAEALRLHDQPVSEDDEPDDPSDAPWL